MKGVKLAFVVIVAALFTTTASADEKGKIGYVDLSRLFDEYYKTKDYDKSLEAEHKEYEQEAKTKVDKIREQQGKLELLKEDQKKGLEADIEKMKNDLMEYDRQKKTTLTKDRNEKIREILLEIEKIVSGYAEQNGYALILNDRVLIYGDPARDLTQDILKTLNNAQPKPPQK
ncbi:MAG: OmpH family outer membrane protein [Candidatus Omnitrophica bacterium]|nr:OmpH family outer membrane protein [Candidatus Omnitrophota bacterium]